MQVSMDGLELTVFISLTSDSVILLPLPSLYHTWSPLTHF